MIWIYTVAYLMSCILASFHFYIASGALLIVMAAVLYADTYRETGRILNITGLYSLSLVGGQGISCLKLSYIQTDWAPMTWICFYLAFIGFRAGNRICLDRQKPASAQKKAGSKKYTEPFRMIADKVSYPLRRFTACRHLSCRRLLIMNCLLAGLTWLTFAVEAAVLGFIPLFVRGVPHAYSIFHITGVHYFTVSCVLCPAFSLIWYVKTKETAGSSSQDDATCSSDAENSTEKTPGMREKLLASASALTGFAIPVLCVSRFQLVFSLMLAVFVWIVICERRGRIRQRTLIMLGCGCVLILVPAYIVLTIARSHDAEYLKSVFEMKKDYPIVVSHFYIYIANNFDNFDCLVKNIAAHTFGRRMLFPLWALTGLKFLFPQLAVNDYFITKMELGTLTLFYDAYYDFGVAGVTVFALLIGMIGTYLESKVLQKADVCALMLYGQFAIYIGLTFFTTWFSNPTTWFYVGVTVLLCLLSLEKTAKAKDPAEPEP